MKLKFANALSLALIMAMLFTSIGLADQVNSDADVVLANNQSSKDLGNVAPGAILTPKVSFALQCQSASNHVDNGATVNISFLPVGPGGSSVPAGGSLTATGASVGPIQPAWPDDGTACGPTSPMGDNGDSTVTITAPNAAGSYTYTVKYSYATSNLDGSALNPNQGSATFTLTVISNTAPVLSLPSNITAEATSASGAVVTYTATASDAQDDPDPTPSCSPASGSTFPLGTTQVNCSVSDSGGMSASGSFNVTVQDTTAPSLNLPSPITQEATGASGAVVTYTASATDLVDGPVSVTCSPASGATFPLGSDTVSCSVSDSSGNSASGSFSVTVQDTTAPTLSLPANIVEEATGPSGNVVNFTATSTDAVDGNVPVSCTPASGSTFPIQATTVDCSATDSHGNTATDSFSVTVADTTAPLIAVHGDETAEATGPGGAIVSYTAPTTSDVVDGAGVASCTPASGAQFPLGSTTVTCTKSDSAGNAATPTTFQVNVVDTTPPTIAFVSRTPANGNGWNNGDVTVTWSCSDLVGVENATVTTTVSTEGEDQSATGTCKDSSGNTASDEQSGINIDKTAPTASASRTPAANSAGWNNSDVTVSFSGTDGLSGIDFCDVPAVLSAEIAGQSASGTCTDKAGNASDPATASDINIDKTAPTASASASPDANVHGWNNSDVTVSFSGSDSLSGIALCSAATVLSSEGAGQVASGTCTDQAGNVSGPATKTVNIDLTVPSVALVGGPANGQSYFFGFVPAAPTCTASDALSGIDGNCSVSGYSTAVGSHTVNASAADKAGNSGSAAVSYTVAAWTLRGFYQPVDMGSVLNVAKNGSTVPLKFEVFAGNTELTNVAFIKQSFVQTLTCGTGVVNDDIENYATGGTSLRYDTTGGQFIFNWQTPKTPGACYKITLMTQDGQTISANFKLK